MHLNLQLELYLLIAMKELKLQIQNETNFEKKLDFIDELKILKKQKKTYISEKKNYFLKNSPIIFDYFEKKIQISKGDTKKTILNDFFKKNYKEVNIKSHTKNV